MNQIIFLASASDARRQDEFWTGADLVMEVVSPGHPQRDLVTKRIEYAQAGILEYWLVDPRVNSIVALPLEGGAYREHGRFQHGETTQSAIFPDLSIHVTGVMDAA